MKAYRVRIFIALFTVTIFTMTPSRDAQAAIPIAKIIKEAVKKVIKAVDLMIQRLQNKTIWLQNAQKILENKLSELKLKEIAEWTEKHRKLYEEYYDELWRVKQLISAYQRIREIMDRQSRIVEEYRRAWDLIRHDDHFTEAELDYIYNVYTGILKESVSNLDQILLVVNSFKTQMTDAQRLAIITQAADRIDQNYIDLMEFNMNTYQISINRAQTQYEVNRLRKLYGIR